MIIDNLKIETDDLFALRRNNSGSGNPRDIESLLTGSEIDRGLGYHDKRVYIGPPHLAEYWHNRALSGHITNEEILNVFPRVHRRNRALSSIDAAIGLTNDQFAMALARAVAFGD